MAEVRSGDQIPPAARLPRSVDGRTRLRPVLPERDGRQRPRVELRHDPAHAWIRDSWAEGQEMDPRLPMSEGRGPNETDSGAGAGPLPRRTGDRARRARRPARGARRPARSRGVGGRARDKVVELGGGGGGGSSRRSDDDGAPAAAGGDHRRHQRRRRGDLRGRLRGGLGAGRPAQALARARPRRQGLPRRVRLLVHGLRDPGRHGRQAGGARARGLRVHRRRFLPHAPPASS